MKNKWDLCMSKVLFWNCTNLHLCVPDTCANDFCSSPWIYGQHCWYIWNNQFIFESVRLFDALYDFWIVVVAFCFNVDFEWTENHGIQSAREYNNWSFRELKIIETCHITLCMRKKIISIPVWILSWAKNTQGLTNARGSNIHFTWKKRDAGRRR